LGGSCNLGRQFSRGNLTILDLLKPTIAQRVEDSVLHAPFPADESSFVSQGFNGLVSMDWYLDKRF